MERFSILRRAPLLTLVIAGVASASIRFAVALQLRTVLYHPDEYLYAAISRSIAHGTLGRVRGARVPFAQTISYLVPLVTSPVWLIHDVAVAYRLSQALASIAFASAGLAAYALARRVGLRPEAACIVGLLSLLVPSGVFTMTLLAEPYAYPLFLVATLAAVEAIAGHSLRWVSGTALLAVALCAVAGLQFLLFAPACFLAYILASPTRRSGAKRAAFVLLLAALAVGALAVVDEGAIASFLDRAQGFHYSPGGIAAWFGVNAFVLAVASGWVIVPGALLGLADLAMSGERRARAFAALSVVLIPSLLVEAAIWGSNGLGLYERFTFYATPLLAIAFVWSVGTQERRRRWYASLAYAAAVAAVLLPLSSRLFIRDDHSPTLLGLSYGLIIHLSSPPLLWAPLLGLMAVLTALVGLEHPLAVAIGAAVVCVVTGVAGGRGLIALDTKTVPRGHVPPSSVLVTDGETDYSDIEQVLFWNPNIDQVLVLGGGPAVDGFGSIPAYARADGLLRTASGAPVRGPFAIGPDTIAFAGGKRIGGDLTASFTAAPTVLAFGWYRAAGLLAPFGRVFAAGGGKGLKVVLRLSSPGTPQTIGLHCRGRPIRQFVVGSQPTTVEIRVPPHRIRNCGVGLSSGGVFTIRGLRAIARASLTVAS